MAPYFFPVIQPFYVESSAELSPVSFFESMLGVRFPSDDSVHLDSSPPQGEHQHDAVPTSVAAFAVV